MSDVVQRFAEDAGGALVRLGYVLASDHAFSAVARRLGWSIATLPPPIVTTGSALRAIASQLDAARANPSSPSAWLDLIEAVAEGVDAIQQLSSASFGAALDALGFANEFPRQLLHWAAAEYLRRAHPRVFSVARAVGLVTVREIDPGPDRVRFVEERFVVPDFGAWLESPAAILRGAWAWADPMFDGSELLDEIASVFRSYGVATGYVMSPASARERDPEDIGSSRWHLVARLLNGKTAAGQYEVGLRFMILDDPTNDDRGIAVVPYVTGTVAATIPLGASLQLSITGAATAQRGVVVFPTRIDVVDELLGETGGTPAAAGLTIAIERSGSPQTVGAGSAGELSFRGWRLAAIATATPAESDIALELSLTQPRLGLEMASGFAGDRSVVDAPFTLGVSARRGVYLGPTGRSHELPGPLSLGTVTLRDLRISLVGVARGLGARATTTAAIALGPISIALHGLGAELQVAFPGSGGNLGVIDVGGAVVPPDGATVAIDTPVVRGGGTVQRHAEHEYRGVLMLDVLGVDVTALGIVDDTPGAANFVAAISATFAPIQLGLGFTLSGLGGLLAIHRRVDVDALRAALRGPGVADLFFPDDPTADAERLLDALATYFPPTRGRHVIGPAAKIGWGTPTLVDGEIALLLELPAPMRLVLLGNVRTALPTADKPIIALDVDFVGEVDFTRKTVAVDASLRDSTVAGFPITGDMAFRMAWGSPPSFVLSVGGFHSKFRPPPGFPALRRVRIPIGADDDPRLDIQGFLAVTSNTAQVGAQVELFASAGPLNIKGSLGFEALLELSPLRFQIDIWAGVALRRGNSVLAGVHLDGTLSGPSPWRIAGEACLSLWFIDLCVDFDATFGRAEAVVLPGRDIWEPLRSALESPESWSVALPPASARVVTLAPPVGEPAVTRIDPVAVLGVAQKVVPLNRRVTRFAEAAPEGTDLFQVTHVRISGDNTEFTPTLDWFAPAQFEKLSDAERLSRPGFEQMVGGVAVTSDAVTAGSEQHGALIYETILIPSRLRLAQFRPTLAAQLAGTSVSAAARAPLRPPSTPTPRVALDEETFVIASTTDLTARPGLSPATSRGAAELALAAYLAANPDARGTLQVVSSSEVA
jgi:hypothetical protein